MNQDIQQKLNNLLIQSYIENSSIYNFGKEISNIIFNLPEKELNNTINTIYESLLRKSPRSFYNSNSNTYYKFFALELSSGIHAELSDSQNDIKFSKKLNGLLYSGLNNPDRFIVQQVSLALNEKNAKRLDNNLSNLSINLSKHVIYHAPDSKEPYNHEQLISFWKKVKEELIIANHNDLIPKFHSQVTDYLESNNKFKDLFITTLVEGLKNSNENNNSIKKDDILMKIGQIRKDNNFSGTISEHKTKTIN